VAHCLKLEALAIELAGFADGIRGPVSFGLAGTDEVCRLLADGYHFLLDIWG
jgi:hypothetical protein